MKTFSTAVMLCEICLYVFVGLAPVTAQMPTRENPQWVGVELGSPDDDFGLSNSYTSYNYNLDAPFPPGCINAQGEVAGIMRYEGEGYEVEIMASWHPMTSIGGTWHYRGGYVKPATIFDYSDNQDTLSAANTINGQGDLGGWALKSNRRHSAYWDGVTLRDAYADEMGVLAHVTDINEAGRATAYTWHQVGTTTSGLPVNAPQGLVVQDGATICDLDAEMLPEGGYPEVYPAALNEFGYIVGNCSISNPDEDFVSTVTGSLVHGLVVSAALWDPQGRMEYNLFESAGIHGSRATDINQANHMIGVYESFKDELPRRGFLLRSEAEGIVDVPSLSDPPTGMLPMSVNEQDHVAGWSYVSPLLSGQVSPAIHAIYWEEDTGLVDLGAMGYEYSWGVKITEQDEVLGTVSYSIVSPLAHVVRWAPEQAIDANEDGTTDTLQDEVINFTACTDVGVVLEASEPLSEVWSWMTLSVNASSQGWGFDLYNWDSPLGFTHFTVQAPAVGGQAVVTLKALEALPYRHEMVLVNEAHGVDDDGNIYEFSYEGGTGAKTVTAAAGQPLVIELYLEDGGRGDGDGEANGQIEFFGGPVGTTTIALIDQLLLRKLTGYFTPSPSQLSNADRNGDGEVNIADIVMDMNDYSGIPVGPGEQIPVYDWSMPQGVGFYMD